MMRLRARIGWRLRCWADRIDREHAFVAFGGYWNHTPSGVRVTVTDGIQVNPPVPGVPLWYASDAYDDAWDGCSAPHTDKARPVVVRSVVRGSRRYWLIDGLEAHAVWVTRQLPDPAHQ